MSFWDFIFGPPITAPDPCQHLWTYWKEYGIDQRRQCFRCGFIQEKRVGPPEPEAPAISRIMQASTPKDQT